MLLTWCVLHCVILYCVYYVSSSSPVCFVLCAHCVYVLSVACPGLQRETSFKLILIQYIKWSHLCLIFDMVPLQRKKKKIIDQIINTMSIETYIIRQEMEDVINY